MQSLHRSTPLSFARLHVARRSVLGCSGIPSRTLITDHHHVLESRQFRSKYQGSRMADGPVQHSYTLKEIDKLLTSIAGTLVHHILLRFHHIIDANEEVPFKPPG